MTLKPQELKVERRVHDLWKGKKQVNKLIKEKIPSVVGKYHYRYTSKKGSISLIKIFSGGSNEMVWEVCGGGITKEQRFSTKIKADRFIRSILL